MKGRQTYVPGVGLVSYVPGDLSYLPVRVSAREIAIPNPDTTRKTDWLSHGGLTVIGLLAACLIADGLTLWAAAWWLTR